MQLLDDRYELLEVIASGGMATVWRARDTRLDRSVAVKRPHPSPPGDEGAERLSREARAAASLSHPNLITVYDVGRDASGPYMVMELADGPTLQDLKGEVDSRDAVEIGRSLADALAAIHAAGIVHRDIKPGNVIMSDRGPLLTDFGIALHPDATSRLTGPGEVVATPSYAAPEVLAGEEPTPASDVYSLAVTLRSLLVRSGNDPDPGISAVLSGALSSTPEERPPAADLADDLRRLIPGEGRIGPEETTLLLGSPAASPTGPESSPPGRWRSLGGVAAGVLAIAALGLSLLGLTLFDDASPSNAAPQPVFTSTSEIVVTTTTPPPPSTVLPTTTTLAATTSPITSTRDELEDLLLQGPRSDMNPPEVEDLMKKVDEAIAAAREGDERKAEEKLREAARRVDEKLDDEDKDEALALLETLADQLGIELDTGDGGGRGRDGDDD